MERLEPFTVSTLEPLLAAYCEEVGLNTGDLIHSLRLATTGQPVGPGVYDCLVLLGKDRSLARIAASVQAAR
jgi:glutamyl-tRNA synthetase